MFANSSKWGLRRFKFAGSPVRWRAIVSSWTLCAKEAGVCNLKNININFPKGHIILLKWRLFTISQSLLQFVKFNFFLPHTQHFGRLNYLLPEQTCTSLPLWLGLLYTLFPLLSHSSNMRPFSISQFGSTLPTLRSYSLVLGVLSNNWNLEILSRDNVIQYQERWNWTQSNWVWVQILF